MIHLYNAYAYCNEDISKIENYDEVVNDTSQMWECHHRLEISPMGNHFSKKYLIEQGLYYHQPATSLIFLSKPEHRRLHFRGKSRSKETKEKISKTLMGHSVSDEQRKNHSKLMKEKYASGEIKVWNKGKHLSDETRKKVSNWMTGKKMVIIDGKRTWR